jgi:integrase/recombinase XerD
MTWTKQNRPDLSVRLVRRHLGSKEEPYWHLFCYGRSMGYLRRGKMRTWWVARARTKTGGYRQHRLARTDDQCKADGDRFLSFEQASRKAWDWFGNQRQLGHFSDALPIGIREELDYTPVGSVYTVGHALSEYLEWKKLTAAKSYAQTLVALINYHLLPRLGTLPVSDFNGEKLRLFVRDVLETPPKRGKETLKPRRSVESLDEETLRKRKGTVNTLIGILRAATLMAWENGKTDSERSWRVLRHIPNVVRPRMLHLSRPECRALLAAAKPEMQRLILGALYTGCRAQELLRMEASQVGRDGYGVYVKPQKNYKPRFVFLPDEGMVFFRELAKGKASSDLLFLRDDGRTWYLNHSHQFKEVVVKAGLPRDFTFHGLRHTYASQLVQAGTPLPVVAEQLGHSNSDTVSATYGHLAPQIREAEVRQRFSKLSVANARQAAKQSKSLRRWRNSLHGSDWRSYATITDLKSKSI